MKSEDQKIDEELDELLSNPRIRRTIIQMGKGKGRAFKFLTKIRHGLVSNKEIVKWIKEEEKKDLKASKKNK